MPDESIENITKSDSNFASTFVDHHPLPDINFNGYCLIKNGISIPKKVISLYISYKLSPQFRNINTDFTLSNCLFGSVKLTKNADPDKYTYVNIVATAQDLILDQNFHLQMEAWEEMLLLLELI